MTPGSFGYGDPPRHDGDGGRCPGDTMACDLIGVLQFWRDDNLKGWRLDPALEFVFDTRPPARPGAGPRKRRPDAPAARLRDPGSRGER